MYYISLSDFAIFLDNLKKDYTVYLPAKLGEQRLYQEYDSFGDDVVIGEVRALEPLKSFFFRAREVVAEGFKDDVPHSGDKPLAIVGVKACDLKGFKVQDHVFQNQDCPEPFYNKAREENLIISADCTCTIDTCFCLALGLKPYPQADFDLNLSEVNGGFVVAPGSKKGEDLISKNSSLFSDAGKEEIEEKDKQRLKVISAVDKNVKTNKIPNQESFEGIIEKNYDASIWKDEAETCVECGACNVICPTCHCFLLYDQKDAKRMARLRIWDSCMIKDFARVAGGANPRERLWMRLRNRFEKKFDFFPKIADFYACTGCGRCISACPAKIDIRKVLKKLVSNV
ncbi:MAG: 4Fe-4S dicluster domain-containing protein [Candidatus Omnitrophica bacterium]|nr:4Fe-4S dicluster domain-containing protein [Candidatus Omnitrophota bacterium]